MAIDKTLQTKRSARGASMDSLSVPDTTRMKDLDRPASYRAGTGINAAADEIFNSSSHIGRTTQFGAADMNYKGSEKMAKERKDAEEDDPLKDMRFSPEVNRKAPDVMHQGVKVGSAYVERRKVVIWMVVSFLLLACALIFLPPLMNSSDETTSVDHDRNVFEDMGMNEFKAYAVANYSVYSTDAFSSEKNESYRVIRLNAHLQNSSPFEVTIPQYKAVHVPGKYKNKVCYVTSAKTEDGKIVGDTIPGFSGEDVTIEIMVNVVGMTDEDLDECITGMILSTVDAKKQMVGNIKTPCIPGFLFVSNTVKVTLEDDKAPNAIEKHK